MAGSYEHVVDDQGRLLSPSEILGMLDTGGDVAEAIRDLYGMIWWLADQNTRGNKSQRWTAWSTEEWVEAARARAHRGLDISPGEAQGT